MASCGGAVTGQAMALGLRGVGMMWRRTGHPEGAGRQCTRLVPVTLEGSLQAIADPATETLTSPKNISCRVSMVVVKSSLVESTREEVIQIDASSSSSRGYLLGEVALT